jgi:putative iron-dependent peroxidase
MKPQAAMLDAVPAHARHLLLDLNPPANPREALHKLAAACDGRNMLLGLGVGTVEALGASIQGLRAFPERPLAKPAIPSTQHALWIWLRGDDPGDLLLRGHELQALIDPDFTLVQAIDSFLHRDRPDLPGYEDGTENPKDEAAIETAVAHGQGAGIDGSSFAAVQQWLHDFPEFDAMSHSEQNDCIGRDRDSNEEFEEAPELAHVKCAAREDFEPEVFVARPPMPWVAGADAGLVSLAFGISLDTYEPQLRRMAGLDDGISDASFRFARPLTGGYYWCPPMSINGVGLSAPG